MTRCEPPQAFPQSPSAELYVEVPENYGGNFPLYLTKVSPPQPLLFLPDPASTSMGTSCSFLLKSLFNAILMNMW